MVHKYFICFTATSEEFIVYCETNKVFLVCMSSKCANLEIAQAVLIAVNNFCLRSKNKEN